MKKMKNLKIIYIIAMLIIFAGIVVTCICKTNFSLEYNEHTRIDLYLGKDYNLEDIKQIAKEVFQNETINYQEIETFHDSVVINVGQASDEQITVLKEKVKEKYEIEQIDESIVTTTVPHYRVRDIVKPYIIPMIITTLILLAYIGIRYLNLGMFKVIFTLLLRVVVAEAVLASIIQIVRIPVGVYTIPVAILLYILVSTITVVSYENKASKIKEEEKKK